VALINDVVAHWKFNESSGNAADSVGSRTLTNNGTTPYVSGLLGNAADLEASGANQYFSRADDSGISGSDRDFAWAAWVKIEAIPANSMFIVHKGSGTSRDYYLAYSSASGQFRFAIVNAGTTRSVDAASYGTPVEGRWTLVIGYHDAGGNRVVIGVGDDTPSGMLWDEATTSGTAPPDTSAQLEIGRGNDGSSRYWDGLIDSVTFWDQTISEADGDRYYNGGVGLDYPWAAGLVKHVVMADWARAMGGIEVG
jgi:hypothetical protein